MAKTEKDPETEEREKLAAAPDLSEPERAAIRDAKLTSIELARYMSGNPAKTRQGVTDAAKLAAQAQAAAVQGGRTDLSGQGDNIDYACRLGQYSPDAKRVVTFDGVSQVLGAPKA